MDSPIRDIIEASKIENADIEMLLRDAFSRGYKEGKEMLKAMTIDAIEHLPLN